MNIQILRKLIRNQKYEISHHAQKERYEENINLEDIEHAVLSGEIIEDYPEDVRGKSCLIGGYSKQRPIHIVCAALPNGWLRIITVYIPKLPKWITPKQRRR